ncbi:hypothetical protein BJX65DRAFT_301897 [Aspergillus insuetus]
MSSEDNPHDAYTPSKPAAIACAIVFLVLSVLQLWKIIRTRKWFGFAIVIGGLCCSSPQVIYIEKRDTRKH